MTRVERCLLGVLVATCVGAYSVTAFAASSQPPRSACAVPDALLAAGETATAKSFYVTILTSAPGTACARARLKALNAAIPKAACGEADAKFDAGDLSGAAARYVALGNAPCAATGLQSVRAVVRLCAQGDEDHALGHDTEARTAYNGALAKAPNAACAHDGIEKLDAMSLGTIAGGITKWTPDVLLVIGILLVILFLVLALLGRNDWAARELRRLPGLRTLLAPRLSLAAFADKSAGDGLGVAIMGRVKSYLHAYREEALQDDDDYDLDYGNGAEEFVDIVSDNGALQSAIKNSRDISDQTKTVAALLDLLYGILPIQKISVDGALDAAGTNEVAATLSLQNGAKQAAAVTLTAPIQGTAAAAGDYSRLARPVAVWIQYEVAQLLRPKKGDPREAATSYALLREGIDRQQENNPNAAERCYEEAVALNRRNWAARVNLASLRARRMNDRLEQAIETVRDALDEMRSDGAATGQVPA
jgi:tetratricopeptide (TPR) repeat protein